jgi:hypothetical protein
LASESEDNVTHVCIHQKNNHEYIAHHSTALA